MFSVPRISGPVLFNAGVDVMGKIFRYPKEKPKKENSLLLLQFLFAVVALVYVTFKPYSMEYKDGVLIVDPQKMMNDGYGDLAMTMIFPIARFIEKKWIRFRPVGCNKKGLIAGIIGSVFFALINQLLKPCLVNLFGSHWGKFLGSGILVFFCIAAYPLIIKLLFNKEDKTEE